MDVWSEDDFDDGEVSFGARSRTRSGVSFSLPSTDDGDRREDQRSSATAASASNTGRRKSATVNRSQPHHHEGPDDSIVIIKSSSSGREAVGVSSERRSSRRSSAKLQRAAAEDRRDQSESASEASEVDSDSDASSKEEDQYQTCHSDVDQGQVRTKRRGVQAKSRDVVRESARKRPGVVTSESRSSPSESGRSTRMLPQVRLGMYRGESCLETFLVKFEDISSYMCWTEEDRLFHLRASLDGVAGQILWDAGPQTSTASVIRLLRARFGTEHQAERFRAELRSRRRQKGESLQKLYNDICRLLALAYPGPANATSTIVGRDAFIDSLGNQTLRVRILEREPKNIEEALNIASRLEAYDRPVSDVGDDDEHSKGRGRQLRQVKDRRDVDHAVNDDVDKLQIEETTR